ncbi:MAG: glycosyltransferase family 39 protein [Deltaproteobacteria bacterium]|nr:glycosyltransferase family 39 protein [Deltaproteobacteria bacterium]
MASLFVVVAWRSVGSVNTLWDEQTDHSIATALVKHPLWGNGEDSSQARLPMYVTAAVYACVGESLSVARLVSIVVGALTVVMTFVAGWRWFSRATGLLAAGLLTISPYFIGFSRTAMTEGDAFCPLTVLLVLLAFEAYLRRRDSQSLLILATTLGVALATKFYAVFFVPALIGCDLLQSGKEQGGKGDRCSRTHRSLIAWIMAAAALEFMAIGAAQGQRVNLSIAIWAAGVLIALLAARLLILHQAVRWPATVGWLAILPVAATVCLAAFPEHVIQPAVARALLWRLFHWDNTQPLSLFVDHARLYSGIVLLKLGVPLGLLSVAALVWACLRAIRDLVMRRVVAAFAVYTILLTTLPLRQTFYLMSVYPLLVLMLAGFIVQVTHALRDRVVVRRLWITIVATSHLWLIWGDVHVYPDFGLYGYETIGDRWLGDESRGYRNVIQMTNDGTEDALRWLVDHVPTGARVVSYLGDDHVIDAFVDRQPLTFELTRRHADSDWTRGPAIDDADYLLVSINNEVMYGDAPPVANRAARFEPVHTIWRGRGRYRMPMVRIYRRRPSY